ncbi:serglycin [Hyla sarda]|uniref:serglycin n=1 Tax=Hyla sarda TaxID=327740 RepID=UPI0024C34C06|nr:serglycin [Hyla sarda]
MIELLHFNTKKMFLFCCVFLLAGSLVQGFPTKKEEYQRIRCIPGENDIGCAQEKAIFDQAQENNAIDRSPISKKVQSFIASIPFSAEDSGSGLYSGEDPGSASENNAFSNEINDSKQYFSEENFIV